MLRMLWEHAMLVKYSKICEFFDGNIFMYLGALFGGPRVLWSTTMGLKIAKNREIWRFKAYDGLKSVFKDIFEEKILLVSFPDTYLGA